MESNLMEVGVKPDSQKTMKKFLEEKDKIITSLNKLFIIPVANHPQT